MPQWDSNQNSQHRYNDECNGNQVAGDKIDNALFWGRPGCTDRKRAASGGAVGIGFFSLRWTSKSYPQLQRTVSWQSGKILHFTQISSDWAGRLNSYNFSKIFSTRLSSPDVKFTADMAYGIVASKSCLLTQISQRLQENTKKRSFQDRVPLFFYSQKTASFKRS